MSNQWGRDSGGTVVRRRGAGGVIFASIVCLALGGVGGYGLARIAGEEGAIGEVALLGSRIEDLNRELETRAKEAEENFRDAQDLRQENEGLRKDLEALRAEGSKPVSTTESQLTQEIRDNLEKDLRLADQRVADAEALRGRAEETVRARDRTISLQADRIARLEKDLEQAGAADGTARTAETEQLEKEAADLRRDLAAAQAEAGLFRDEIARKEAEIVALDGEKDALSARIARLEKDMEQAGAAEGAARTAETERLEKEAGDLRRDLAAAQAEAGLLRDEIARKETEIAALGEEKDALSARIAALQAEETRAAEPAPGNDKPADSRSPRNAALVTLALEGTPGLDRLSTDQRGLLERSLLSGECVTNALGAVFQRVPVLTLRNLMRDLDSDC